jgi:hypothetical protein
MSTPVATDGHLRDDPNFCKSCGAPLAGGRFCPECGEPIAAVDDELRVPDTIEEFEAPDEDLTTPAEAPVRGEPAVEASTEVHPPYESPVPPAPVAPAATDPVPRRGNKRALIAGLLIGVIAIAGAVVAVLTFVSKDDGPSADTVYRQKIASAMGPVLGANRQASDALAHLRGKKVKSARATDARIAVSRAQRAITLATGAVGALSVPAGSEQLGRDTRQVLDREHAYYAGVARVLAQPVTSATGGVQESASDLTSSLSVAGPTVAGTQPTVSGTTRLVNWAGAIRKAYNKHKASTSNQSGNNPSSNNTGGSGKQASPQPASRHTPCGSGVFAGPNTSCAFALNVHRAWLDAPGTTNTVRVFSPVTGETYTMSCSPSGSGISCSGANNASVTF